MATNGSVSVDLNNFSDMVNGSTTLASKVTGGVADQGDLIGIAMGLTIAIGLLFGVVIAMLVFIVVLIRKTKGIQRA